MAADGAQRARPITKHFKERYPVDNGLLVGLSRQAVLERQFDVVANNIANVNTTGFKSSASVFQEMLSPSALETDFSGSDAKVHFVYDRTAFHNFAQGPIQRTGNPLDIALEGDGFLAVQTTAGERYTRNGALQINSTGILVTGDGDTVEGDGGPITFQAADRNISISADGRISVVEGANSSVETQRGRLRLVSFAQPQQLNAVGASLYAAPGGVTAQPATNLRLLQGATEGSNVDAVAEMTRMIEINRTYSMIASLLQTQSDDARTSLDKLAQVPS
jgi:flagellar basal-body rod protein FlgF